MSGSILIPLSLGSFTFDDYAMETPEQLGDMGGALAIAQHDFPGGIRTQTQYGYFPAAVRWRARFSGTGASERVEEVRRILGAGSEITLTWGERRWAGLLAKFATSARHTWLFEYECEFWPRVDLSSGQGNAVNTAPAEEEILDLQILALNSWIGPDSVVLFSPLAAILLDPINAVLDTLDTALSLAQGLVSLISTLERLSVQTAVSALLYAATPLLDVFDPLIAAPAWDIYSRALVIRNLVRTTVEARWVVPSINPNLLLLSAQYYGDAALWRTIADANGLFDPQPIGDFQILIPPPP